MASLEVVGAWALALTVKLGIPVVILFLLGSALHQRNQTGRRAPAGRPLGQPGTGHTSVPKVKRRSVRCWEVRDCPPETRDPCPAFRQRQLPCWQAIKQASGGYIQTKCLGCSLLLSR